MPYDRDPETYARYWAVPEEGHSRPHRIGGLEKDSRTGAITTDPHEHEVMVKARQEKVARIANDIPDLEVFDPNGADTLLVGWGGTYGHLRTAAAELNAEGHAVAFAQFRYMKVIVAELNTGQFADFMQSRFPRTEIYRINKVQAQPFLVGEVKAKTLEIINR